MAPKIPAIDSEFMPDNPRDIGNQYHGRPEWWNRPARPAAGYFEAALRLANAVTMSFWAKAMASLAVVMFAPVSLSGNCTPR